MFLHYVYDYQIISSTYKYIMVQESSTYLVYRHLSASLVLNQSDFNPLSNFSCHCLVLVLNHKVISLIYTLSVLVLEPQNLLVAPYIFPPLNLHLKMQFYIHLINYQIINGSYNNKYSNSSNSSYRGISVKIINS